jgi:hypothetical protein
MTKSKKLILTAEEIMNQSDYMDNRNKQFLDADEVKKIIDEVLDFEMVHLDTHKLCIRRSLFKKLGLIEK